MTQFELELRQGLMDANLAQYKRVLENADAAETDFSPAYLRERMRLLADPWSWMKRRERGGAHRRTRLNWRLVAIVAALLLLSACAYAVATGQFSQWFPWLGADPQTPEVSEEVLSRTGTVVGQSQTVGNETVTLNAAVWDSSQVRISLAVNSPNLLEELTKDSQLYFEECRLELSKEQLRAYLSAELAEWAAPEELEEQVQRYMEMEPPYLNPMFILRGREGDTLTFEAGMELKTYVEKPELTLHLENIAIFKESGERIVQWIDGIRTGPNPEVSVLKGPFDFTFTLEEPILPIRRAGDVPVTAEDIPFRFTGFEISAFDMDFDYEVLAPVEFISAEEYYKPEQMDPDKLYNQDVSKALHQIIQGLWTEDGGYVDLSQRGGDMGISTSEDGVTGGSVGVTYPYPIDPAAVTAVNIAGTRVELSELERVDE